MPKIHIAALDLDGTLLSHENTITPRTRQAIADAAARGVVVLPATGRALANLPPLVAQLPGVRYAITSNGAAVWDLGTDPLGIPHECTLAVGDSDNDRAMLEKAGVAAVMANGMERVKQLADIVSENDCDHDGVAEIFARLSV